VLLVARREMLPVNDETIQYRGAPGAVDAEIVARVLGSLRAAKPLLSWIPSGGVFRDLDKATAWTKWYCDYQHRQFQREPVDNCRLTLLLLAQPRGPSANFLFRYEPMAGEGSIGFRSFIWRIADDEYVCFEY
jgi:hypothetical protein